MKNIVSIAPYTYLPANTGGRRGIAIFYRFFSKYFTINCITTKGTDASLENNYNILPVLSNSPLRYVNPLNIFRIKKILKETNANVLIIEHPYFGWLGYALKKLTSCKLIVHSHNIESTRFKEMGKWWWRILWQYEKFTYNIADHVFFITDEDKMFAVNHYGLSSSKGTTITYGFEFGGKPSAEEKNEARHYLCRKHNISEDEHILLFNGVLDYAPNKQALTNIINHINPLLAEKNWPYKIIICGKNLPQEFNEFRGITNIIYAGFVEDIGLYFKGADIFINPVIDGGGIKTKLVEALGANLTAVSSKKGAIGVPQEITNNKLTIVPDNDWQLFTEAIIQSNISDSTPQSFYDHFYWENICQKAALVINTSL